MTALRIAIAALAVWRLTHLLQAEDGPLEMFARCRTWLRRMSLSGVTDCFYCLSLWVAAPFAMVLASHWEERLTLWLALSGAAILTNRLAEEEPEGAWFYEEPTQEEMSTCRVAEMEEDY
ncbi:MAG: hypothetical protein ACYDBH_11475 [Acidobacteriaceae bacterium]